MTIRVHVPLADDVRGRVFAATGVAAPVELIIEADPLRLEPAEREHLRRMAPQNTARSWSVYDPPGGAPPGDVWIGAYTPFRTDGRVWRDRLALSLDARDDDAIVVAGALAALGAAEDGAAAGAAGDGAAVAAAAIRADRRRWQAAYDAVWAGLTAAIDSWIAEAEARAADLHARGAAALLGSPAEAERPSKPPWYQDVVASADARAPRVAAAWTALADAWDAAAAQARAAAAAQARAAAAAEQADQARRAAAMHAWIAAHGSERLRALADGGYPVWREYVRERTAAEFPEFLPDLDRRARWRDLDDGDEDAPTTAQLALARRRGGRAVWLLRDPRGAAAEVVAVVYADSPVGVPLIEAAAVGAGDGDDE